MRSLCEIRGDCFGPRERSEGAKNTEVQNNHQACSEVHEKCKNFHLKIIAFILSYLVKTLEEVFEVVKKNKQAGAAASASAPAASNSTRPAAASADVLPTQVS